MAEIELNVVFDRLSKRSGFQSGLPATDVQIENYEDQLGMVFPESYREFLRRFGYAKWDGGNYLAGIDDGYFSVIKETQYHVGLHGNRPSPTVIAIFTETVMFCEPSERVGEVQTTGGVTRAEQFVWQSLADYLIDRGKV